MTEILNIFLQFFIFLTIFMFPINSYYLENNIFKNFKFSLYDILSLNILIHFNLFLLISFFDFDMNKYFFILIFMGLIFGFIEIKKYLKNSKLKKESLLYFLIFSLISLSIFFQIAEKLILEWDAINHWIYKVSHFYYGHSILNMENIRFSEYPHLGSYVWAFFWKNSLLNQEYFGRLFYSFFYVVSIFSLVTHILTNKNIKLNIIISLFVIIITYDIFLFSGYQAYLLFSALVIASRFLLEHRKIRHTNLIFFCLIIFILQSIIWFKDEGIFYYILFATVMIFYGSFNIKKKICIILLVFSFPIIQFVIQKFIMGTYAFQAEIIPNSFFEMFKDPKILLHKLFLITKYIFISFVKYNIWFLNLFSLVIIYFVDKKLFKSLMPWIVILILNIGLIYSIYLHTPYDLKLLLTVTLDRLLFQTSGIYLVFPLVLIKKYFN